MCKIIPWKILNKLQNAFYNLILTNNTEVKFNVFIHVLKVRMVLLFD